MRIDAIPRRSCLRTVVGGPGRGSRMTRMREFRILGPLEVLHDGRPVELGGQRQRALLAALLLHHGQVVSTDRLVDLPLG